MKAKLQHFDDASNDKAFLVRHFNRYALQHHDDNIEDFEVVRFEHPAYGHKEKVVTILALCDGVLCEYVVRAVDGCLTIGMAQNPTAINH